MRPVTYQPTAEQARTLEFIRSHIADKGFAPSAQEIAAAFGLEGHSAIQKQLTRLEENGLIRRVRNSMNGRVIHRSITVLG